MAKYMDKILKCYMAITLVYIFIAHFKFISLSVNVHTTYLLISGLLLIFYFMVNFKKIKFSKTDLLMFVTIVYLFVSNFLISIANNSINRSGIKYLLFFVTINLIAIFLKKETKWSNWFSKGCLIFSLIHCCFIILHSLFPNLVLSINQILQTKSVSELIEFAMGNNYYSGITIGPASAGLFSTILVGLSASKIFSEKKFNFRNILFLLIGLIALFLSQKRAFLLASAFSAFVLFCLVIKLNSSKKEFIKKACIFIVVMLALLSVVCLFPQTRNIIDKIINDDNLLSGREELYIQMLAWFKSNIMFGVGLGSAHVTFGYGGHNIYLQVLAESGIIGAIVYFSFLFKMCFLNFKILLKNKLIDYRVLFAIFVQVVLIIYGLTGNPIYDYSYLVFFTFVISIPCSVKREEIQNDKCNNTNI